MNLRNTIHTAVSSYGQMLSVMLAALLTVRLATQMMSPGEFGLWSFTFQSVGYFLLLDFGVANALGRLFGEPLASGKAEVANGWFNLALFVLIIQGLIIFIIGFLSREWVITWFGIPEDLTGEARKLWTWFLFLQAVNLPFRVTGAILHAQNRVYWTNISGAIVAWISFASFWVCLKNGMGVMSYAYSSTLGVGLTAVMNIAAVATGPHRFWITFVRLPWTHLKEIFGYSWTTFVIGIAIQVSFASQTLIITKLLGLEASAIYNVASRIPLALMPLIWKPFDAFTPRWQQWFCSGETSKISEEYKILFRMTLLLGFGSLVGVMMVGPSFVNWWTKPEYFGGNALNIWLGIYVVWQTYLHCFSFAFNLHKKMTKFASIVAVTVILEVVLEVICVHFIGLAGVPVGSLLASSMLAFWFINIVGGKLIGAHFGILTLKELPWILPSIAGAAAIVTWLPTGMFGGHFQQFICSLILAFLVSAPICFRLYQIARPMMAAMKVRQPFAA